MIISVANLLFAGYLSSFCRGSDAANSTVVLLAGHYGGMTETYPCNLGIGDVGTLYSAGAMFYNGRIMYCGGGGPGGYHRECYTNVGMDWIRIESMNVDRLGFTLNPIGDTALAAGGTTGKVVTNTMEKLVNGYWQLLPFNLTSPRNSHCAVPVSANQIMIVGGSQTVSLGSGTSLVELYDIEKGFVAKLPSMPTAREGLACTIFQGEVWAAGGYSELGHTNVVEVLTPWSNSWRAGPNLVKTRYLLTMHTLEDNLLVFGGYGGEGSFERLTSEGWKEESLQHEHGEHVSVVIPCL